MTRKARFARWLTAASLAIVAGWPAAGLTTEAPTTQEEAEQRLETLKRDIGALQSQLTASRAEHRAAQDELRSLDLAIQETTRTLRALDAELAAQEAKLAELQQERDAERERMQAHEDELATLLASTYRLARQSRIKLVLNQEDPLQLARLLAYHDHINRSQADRIDVLRDALQHLESLYRAVDEEVARLEALRGQQRQGLETRQQQRAERQGLLAELAERIGGDEARLAQLERDRADLERLVERLGDALADIPTDLARQVDLVALKGRLSMPVSARVRHAFGQQRTAGLRWQGWLLDAPAGTEVRSIAHGRVAFADWFRGYGLMLIIDHGQGFMSLYGYNESLLWEVGDWVEPAAVIATVGTGPGGEQGLYFELRRDGKPLDPAAWLQR